MEYRSYLPHPILRPYIENYWHIRLSGTSSLLEECCIVPDGNTGLMFIGAPISRRSPNQINASELNSQCLLVGQKSNPVFYTFSADGPIDTYGVRFRPFGLSRFLKISMHHLKDQSIDSINLFGTAIDTLQRQISQQKDFQEKLTTLNNFFLRRLLPYTEKYAIAMHLVQTILKQKGQIKIAALAQNAGVSSRQLDRLFQQYLGLSPKYFARIVRFNHCIFLQKKMAYDKLTDLAYANGYFDQMHFIKEVKLFTHQTPKHFFTQDNHLGDALQEILQERFEQVKFTN